MALRKETKPLPTQAYLHERLDYDPETGIFRWLSHSSKAKCWNSRFAGKRAGGRAVAGRYRDISIDDVAYYEHRVAWVYMTGDVDEACRVDHRDLDGTNNKWCNLRPATNSQNVANTHGRSVIGCSKGTYFAGDKFAARITVDYQCIYLGVFTTMSEAHQAYCAAAEKHFGEFARAA